MVSHRSSDPVPHWITEVLEDLRSVAQRDDMDKTAKALGVALAVAARELAAGATDPVAPPEFPRRGSTLTRDACVLLLRERVRRPWGSGRADH